jgi:hypothetical protein
LKQLLQLLPELDIIAGQLVQKYFVRQTVIAHPRVRSLQHAKQSNRSRLSAATAVQFLGTIFLT